MRARTWQMVFLGALSGLLYFLSFAPYGIGPLAWVALVPLVLAVRRATSARQAVLAGGLAGFVTCAGGYFWIATMAHRFWEVPWVFAVLLLAVFSTFGKINLAVFALVAYLARRPLRVLPAAATAAVFVGCEMVLPKIFPDKLGHTQVGVSTLPYAASLVGSHGLSFVLAWGAAALAWSGDRKRHSRAHRRLEILVWALAFVSIWIYGAVRKSTLMGDPPKRDVQIVIVQSNLGDAEWLADALGSVPQAVDSTLSIYIGLTREALRDRSADLVVWPETAMPSIPHARALAPIQNLVRETKTPLVFGGYEVESLGNKKWKLYNAAFLMFPDGVIHDRYYKHKLLLLGEYVPFSKHFPTLLDLLPTPGEFTPGPGPNVFRVNGTDYLPLICYELLFSGVVRRGLRSGGEVIVNLTNDYWFGEHGEPEQHLTLCRMSAFETGRPIVRATNTGISALIDATGAIRSRTGLWTQEVLHGSLSIPSTPPSFYVRFGEWTSAVMILLVLATVGLLWRLVP